MIRGTLNGGSSAKQQKPLINILIKPETTPFRLRRNKWSIIKLILIATVSIFLFIKIKSLLKDQNNAHPDNSVLQNRNPVEPLGVAEHLPLIGEKIRGDLDKRRDKEENYQVSPEPSSSDSYHTASHNTPVNSLSIPIGSATNSFDPARQKKKRFDKSELRKQKLDEELKKLLPVVSGWGEQGTGVKLTAPKEVEAAAEVFKQGAYNVYVSDRISPNRTLRSVVAKECNDVKYDPDNLPNTSVIIIFTNEIFSALVRTVWSVINRTPKKLLKEIILVDDFSDKSYLKSTLQDYIDIYWNTLPGYENSTGSNHEGNKLVKLVHLPERLGLIKARLKGARMARGDVLLFLDSHCEATDYWLEPLLQRIKENDRVFICPVIDIINDKTLEYNSVDPYYFQVGGFDWTGHFTWISRNEEDARQNPTKVAKSPTMAGGLFAVDRKYFFKVGAYDEDMKIWGGENLELSFRAWQCGGRIEIHPCSHVGHIFRDFHPYSFNGIDSHGFNTLRTVMVWMDEYSRYFYMSRPDLLKSEYGDLTARHELRKKLGCESFSWYLENVYENRKFIYDKKVKAYGWVKNEETNLCIDVLNKQETVNDAAGLYVCEDMTHPLNVTTNQLFSYSRMNEIRREESCLTISSRRIMDEKKRGKNDDSDEDSEPDSSASKALHHKTGKAGGLEDRIANFHRVMMSQCEEPAFAPDSSRGHALARHRRQKWRYVKIHPRSNHRLLISQATGKCLTTQDAHSYSDLMATDCDKEDPRQYWKFQIHVDLHAQAD